MSPGPGFKNDGIQPPKYQFTKTIHKIEENNITDSAELDMTLLTIHQITYTTKHQTLRAMFFYVHFL